MRHQTPPNNFITIKMWLQEKDPQSIQRDSQVATSYRSRLFLHGDVQRIQCPHGYVQTWTEQKNDIYTEMKY